MIANPVIPSVENFLNQEAFLPPLRMHLRHSVVIRATLWFKSNSLVLFKYPSILKSSSDQKIPVGVVPFSLNSSTLGKVIHAIVSELPIEAEIMDAPGAKFWSISGENQEEIEKVIPAIFQTLHCGDTDKGEEIIECQILDAHEFFLISASLNRLPWRQTTRISRPYLFISQHCQPTALGEAIKRAIKNIREENPLKNFNR